MAMKELDLNEVRNIVDELEFFEDDLLTSRNFFHIIFSEIDKDEPTPEEASQVYKRLYVLNTVYLDRINEVTNRFSEIFKKLHNKIYDTE